jgi:hypothetical protein
MLDLRTHSTARRPSPILVALVLGITLSGALASYGGPAGTAAMSTASVHVPLPVVAHSSRSVGLVAFPPVHVHPLEVHGQEKVNPTGGYPAEPAPMGIGDFGVGQGGNPYTYNTTEFLGNFSWQNMSFQNGGDTWFTDQLNVVLQFVQSEITYAYWIQDVAFMDSASGDLSFEDNIWNMTTSQSCLNSTGVSSVYGNGTVTPISGCEGYYAAGATSQPGASETMPPPGDFAVLVRSYEAGSGVPEVAFEYWDGVTSYYVTYDNVVWPWATAISADNNFVVDGTRYNPGGWFYDAELTIGGPGGGSSTTAEYFTHITSRLLYFNGHNFEAPPSVWNFGANTAERVSNIQSIFSHDPAGLPLTLQLNGTTRNATPALAYDQGRVGVLDIAATGISRGTVTIPGDSWAFVNGSASLTLVPGTYPVWVNSTSGSTDMGNCTVLAGTTTDVAVSSGCTPEVSTPTASVSSVDLNQSVTFHSTLLSPGSGGDTYVWQSSPAGLGCIPSPGLTISCTPTATGTYRVNLTVTDSTLRSSTSGTLTFVVHTDPTVGAPSPSRSTAETGATVTFTASPSGGASPYSYSWSGLPSPCTGTDSSSPTCSPGTAGGYSVQVTVTDSDNYVVVSPTLAFTVTQGPSITTPTSNPPGSIDLGQPVHFSVAASGGSGGFSYSWSGLPNGCASLPSAEITCVPTAIGSTSVRVEVVDKGGGTATSGPLLFTVYTDPSLGKLKVLPATVDVGQSLEFSLNGTISGGAGAYRYVWSDLPIGCATDNATALFCVPSAAGSGAAKLTVYDANNGSDASTVSFEVFVDPSVARVSASPGSVDLGQNVTFTAVGVSGGSGTYRYAWSGLPTGCVGTDLAVIVCLPEVVGVSHPTVNVTDSNGFSVVRSLSFTVDPVPTVGTPYATPGSVGVGQNVTLSVNVSGGSGSFTYTWSGLPAGCGSVNASTLVCRPSAAGTANITVHVVDSNGVSVVSGVLRLAVSSPATSSGLTTTELYLLIGVVGAIVVVAVVLLAARNRRRRSPPGTVPPQVE